MSDNNIDVTNFELKECSIKCEDSLRNRRAKSNSNHEKRRKTEDLKVMEKIKKDKEKKDEEKKKKEEQRKQKEFERQEEKKRKEEERKLKEAEKEEEKKRKKQKELDKEEERKKKEEERRVKDLEKEEEKRKRDEEKRRKENEKKKEEEEKNRKIEKQRAILKGFLKVESVEEDVIRENKSVSKMGFFKPLELKKDMKMAYTERVNKRDFKTFEEILNDDDKILLDLPLRNYEVVKDTWPEKQADVEVICASIITNLNTKIFYFDENVRPPYCGTWRKISKIVTPLNPLAEDDLMDYEADSDADWEYESGEDIGASEGEEEEDDINEEPADLEFVVPHGYLSDGEDCSDVDPEEIEHRSKPIPLTPEKRQMLIEIKEKQFQAEIKQKVQSIDPNCVGPHFQNDPNLVKFEKTLEPYKMICRSVEGIPIICNLQSDVDVSSSGNKTKSVPSEAIPYLIRLLHCNRLSRMKLCYEFRMFWEKHLTGKIPDVTLEDDLQGKDWDEFTIGKGRLVRKIKEIAERKENKWIVKSEIILEYQICCVDDDPEKPCLESWEYVSEVDNIESVSRIMKKIKNMDVQILNNNNI